MLLQRRGGRRLASLLGLLILMALGVACAAPAGAPVTSSPGGAPSSSGGAAPTAAPARPAAPTASAQSALAPLARVRVGFPSLSLTQLGSLVAQGEGYYARQGLDVELLQTGPQAGLAALTTN